jgi:hypothetical protein
VIESIFQCQQDLPSVNAIDPQSMSRLVRFSMAIQERTFKSRPFRECGFGIGEFRHFGVHAATRFAGTVLRSMNTSTSVRLKSKFLPLS